MIDTLKEFDTALFLKLNGLHAPWLDPIMFYMTKAVFWIPVYIILLILIKRTYNWKIALWSLLGLALVITLADRISVELFKEVFLRYRPSHNLNLTDSVYIVNDYRGGKYGFVSSHATNFFGIGTFISLLIRKKYPRVLPWIYVWVLLICYTRIYLGVHYPADIACGALLGTLIGFLVYNLFKYFILKRR